MMMAMQQAAQVERGQRDDVMVEVDLQLYAVEAQIDQIALDAAEEQARDEARRDLETECRVVLKDVVKRAGNQIAYAHECYSWVIRGDVDLVNGREQPRLRRWPATAEALVADLRAIAEAIDRRRREVGGAYQLRREAQAARAEAGAIKRAVERCRARRAAEEGGK
jgi:hypothetical protein